MRNEAEFRQEIANATRSPKQAYGIHAEVDGHLLYLAQADIGVLNDPREAFLRLSDTANRIMRLDLQLEQRDVDKALVNLVAYPDALSVVEQQVELMKRGGESLLLLGREMWDAFKIQAYKRPAKITQTDEAIFYNGLEIRCSAVD